ncbi:MAG: hypothetical protein DCC49_08165 [Acidobacteria bacterium]|nr:MAG: hypothetical protein DCC49_08165 [Acidobacteriota bacterium]
MRSSSFATDPSYSKGLGAPEESELRKLLFILFGQRLEPIANAKIVDQLEHPLPLFRGAGAVGLDLPERTGLAFETLALFFADGHGLTIARNPMLASRGSRSCSYSFVMIPIRENADPTPWSGRTRASLSVAILDLVLAVITGPSKALRYPCVMTLVPTGISTSEASSRLIE